MEHASFDPVLSYRGLACQTVARVHLSTTDTTTYRAGLGRAGGVEDFWLHAMTQKVGLYSKLGTLCIVCSSDQLYFNLCSPLLLTNFLLCKEY